MERRTLVKSGASSFTVALPIDWVRRNKLDKGSSVSLDETEIGDLLIRAERELFAAPQSYHTINVTPENAALLYWEIVRAYLKNYVTINIEGDSLNQLAASVLQRLTTFIGLDVIEHNKNVIVLKNFSVHDTETSPYTLLKKIDVGVRAMFESIQGFFSHGFHHDDVAELQSQHAYNERIHLFALKLINSVVDRPGLMRTFKTDYRQLMRESLLIGMLHEISFHLSRIGGLLLFIDHTSKGARVLEDIMMTLYAKYRTIVAMPKSPISTETLLLLKQSAEDIKKWESRLKEVKNAPLIDVVGACITITSSLDRAGLHLLA